MKISNYITVALTWILLFFPVNYLYAAPNISGVNGEFVHKDTVILRGIGFSEKSNSTPVVYDNFENGINSNLWDNPYGMTVAVDDRNTWANYVCVGDLGTNWARCLVQKNIMGNGYSDKIYVYVLYKCSGNWNWNDEGWENGFKWMRIKDFDEVDEFCWSEVGNNSYLSNNSGNVKYNMVDPWCPKENMIVDKWYSFEFIIKAPSSNNSIDAYAKWYVNGQEISGCSLDEADNLVWCYRDYDNNLNGWRAYRFGWHINSGYISPGSLIMMDDAYIDNSWARVMLGNNPVFENCTHREIQIPTAWSDTEITIQFNQGSFQDGDTAYLFVIDEDGNASPGYEITVGGTPDNDPPTVSGQNPAPGATNVAKHTYVSAHIKDSNKGVDSSSVKMYINGTEAGITLSGDKYDYTVTTANEQNFDIGQNVDIRITAQDLNTPPNVMDDVTYNFTVKSNLCDIDLDGDVDTDDASAIKSQILGTSSPYSDADVNEDGITDTRDIQQVINAIS